MSYNLIFGWSRVHRASKVLKYCFLTSCILTRVHPSNWILGSIITHIRKEKVIYDKNKNSKKMFEWTGERYLPFADPKINGVEIHYEHLHRYYFAFFVPNFNQRKVRFNERFKRVRL